MTGVKHNKDTHNRPSGWIPITDTPFAKNAEAAPVTPACVNGVPFTRLVQ